MTYNLDRMSTQEIAYITLEQLKQTAHDTMNKRTQQRQRQKRINDLGFYPVERLF